MDERKLSDVLGEFARTLAREGWPVGVNYRSDDEAANAVVEQITSAGGRATALSPSTRRGGWRRTIPATRP